jgi:hypothetical protein
MGCRPAETPATPNTLREALESGYPDECWATAVSQSSDNGEYITDAIRSSIAIAVSDGSFKDNFGMVAWVVEGATSAHRICGANVSPGHPNDQGAYRSELLGMYGFASAVASICRLHRITAGSIEVACDGKNALHRVFETEYPVTPRVPHYDLILAIRALTAQCPIEWKF